MSRGSAKRSKSVGTVYKTAALPIELRQLANGIKSKADRRDGIRRNVGDSVGEFGRPFNYLGLVRHAQMAKPLDNPARAAARTVLLLVASEKACAGDRLDRSGGSGKPSRGNLIGRWRGR